MGNFEKLGVLVIIILVVVILVLTIWGVGVPTEEILDDSSSTPAALDSRESNGSSALRDSTEDRNREDGNREEVVEEDHRQPIRWPVDDETEEEGRGNEVVHEEEGPDPDPEPRVVEHVLKRGETLYSLAQAYYGDGSQYRRIQAANPGLNAGSLSVGQRIRIRLDAEEERADRVEDRSGGRTYVVQKGDSLWSIARKVLGNGDSWRSLHDANRDVIGADPGNLAVGMELRIPR